MYIIFDKNLETENQIFLNGFSEHKKDNRFSGYLQFEVKEGSDFPVVPDIKSFTTVECVTDAGIQIPMINEYNNVDYIEVSYDDTSKVYNFNVVLTWII